MTTSDSEIPKLSPLRLSAHVADLLLVSEGSVEAVRDPRTRLAWHLFFFSTLGILLIQGLLGRVVVDWIDHSTTLSFAWRCFHVASWSWLLGALGFLTYRHYRFLMLTKKDLRFQNVAFFFFIGIFFFGLLYRDLYVLSPTLFVLVDATVVPGDTAVRLPVLESFRFTYDFVLYSACISTSIDYPRIASASAIVTLVNFIQVVSSLLLIALLVATFVQHAEPD